jgi:autophagy-related protein 5
LPFGLHTNSDAGSIASNTHSQSGGGGGAGGASIATASNSPDSAYAARAIPFKIYLPYNGPVIQDVSPPLNTDGTSHGICQLSRYCLGLRSYICVCLGKANTVKDLLYRILPGLFPTTNNDPYSLAVPYLHGVELPPDAELAWLACCSPGADGWLRIGIRLCE